MLAAMLLLASCGGSAPPPTAPAINHSLPQTVTFVNDAPATTVWTPAIAALNMAALQIETDTALAPLWGYTGGVTLVAGATRHTAGFRQIMEATISEECSGACIGADGCHCEDSYGPISFVRSGTSYAISLVESHELAEMLGNPTGAATITGPQGQSVLREDVDPVVCLYKMVNVQGTNVALADFVTPGWFGISCPQCAGQFDWLGAGATALQATPITQEFQTCPGIALP